MRISPAEVRYIARLARLHVAPEEEDRMAEEMGRILTYMEQLNALDTENVPPMSHVLELRNVFREDAVERRLSHDRAMRSAPDSDGEYFRVPKVIE